MTGPSGELLCASSGAHATVKPNKIDTAITCELFIFRPIIIFQTNRCLPQSQARLEPTPKTSVITSLPLLVWPPPAFPPPPRPRPTDRGFPQTGPAQTPARFRPLRRVLQPPVRRETPPPASFPAWAVWAAAFSRFPKRRWQIRSRAPGGSANANRRSTPSVQPWLPLRAPAAYLPPVRAARAAAPERAPGPPPVCAAWIS